MTWQGSRNLQVSVPGGHKIQITYLTGVRTQWKIQRRCHPRRLQVTKVCHTISCHDEDRSCHIVRTSHPGSSRVKMSQQTRLQSNLLQHLQEHPQRNRDTLEAGILQFFYRSGKVWTSRVSPDNVFVGKEVFTFKKIHPGRRGQLQRDKGIEDRVRSKIWVD